MSWMDSWSRPSKHSAIPPPLYITQGPDVPYCHTCGRVMSSKKATKPKPTLNAKTRSSIKYCSDRCRNRKPGSLDRKVEQSIVTLLNSESGSGIERTGAEGRKAKGDRRVIVTMEEIEEIAFGRVKDPEKCCGRYRKRRPRGTREGEWRSIDMESDGSDDGGSEGREGEGILSDGVRGDHVRPSQKESDVNFSVGGERGKQEKIEENEEMRQRRDEGQKRAEEREIVRKAARRGVVFGFVVDHGSSDEQKLPAKGEGGGVELGVRRKAEALMNGSVVEPSFAKGNWSIRWRE